MQVLGVISDSNMNIQRPKPVKIPQGSKKMSDKRVKVCSVPFFFVLLNTLWGSNFLLSMYQLCWNVFETASHYKIPKNKIFPISFVLILQRNKKLKNVKFTICSHGHGKNSKCSTYFCLFLAF